MKTIQSIVITLAFLCSSTIMAQELEVLGSSGASGSNSDGSLSYTVGELVVATEANSSGILTQGFHQGFLTPTAIDEVPDRFELSMYPNPTSDILFLESARLAEFERFELYDMNGRLVWQQDGTSGNENRMQINFSNYAAGTYLLRISGADEGEVYTYNVVKSH